ncbi:MAG: DUF2092 domain-containing protein [Candidatus Odyssella sp.]|nr:DUF2092 domain-containing protein [Candidatus Odyssella sp.]
MSIEMRKRRWSLGKPLKLVALAVLCAGLPAQSMAETRIDADAERILKSMSAYLGGLKSFSFEFDVDDEYVLRTGEKVQISAWGTTTVARPGQGHVVRRGGFADLDMVYDGKVFTVYGRKTNSYAQKEIAGNLDALIDALRDDTGLQLAAGDLLYSDVAAGLTSEAESGKYWGTTLINGVECHYLSFRARHVDWQIWISTGDKPLPMKYVITSKWMTGAPQYAIRINKWNTSPKIEASQFAFTPPAAAKKLDDLLAVPANEAGLEIE